MCCLSRLRNTEATRGLSDSAEVSFSTIEARMSASYWFSKGSPSARFSHSSSRNFRIASDERFRMALSESSAS